jgi:hypothetical protein
MKSPTCWQAASTRGEPGQFVASPHPCSPASVSIFRSVQLYLIPSTRKVLTFVIRMRFSDFVASQRVVYMMMIRARGINGQ